MQVQQVATRHRLEQNRLYFARLRAFPAKINSCLSVLQVVNHPAFDTVRRWVEQDSLGRANVILRIEGRGEIKRNQDSPVGRLLLVKTARDVGDKVAKGCVG